jgi:hypothetical protein
MGIHPPVGTFSIDARTLWLHHAPLRLQDNVMPNAHIKVYNGAHRRIPAALCIWLKKSNFLAATSAPTGCKATHWAANKAATAPHATRSALEKCLDIKNASHLKTIQMPLSLALAGVEC